LCGKATQSGRAFRGFAFRLHYSLRSQRLRRPSNP
jgi:hypothetical protein